MKEVRFFYVPHAVVVTELPEEETAHALRVLRLKVGDEIMLMDGEGCYYRAEVTLAHKRCEFRITERLPQVRQWMPHFHLAIAPTKMMERMEWMTEKAVEVGVDEMTFLNCQFSERTTVKLPRIERIMISAVKQSHKAWKTQMNEVTPFSKFIQQPIAGRKYIAHCYEEIPRTYLFDELRKQVEQEDATVMIGPEGDFSVEEVRQAMAAGFVSVHLGKSRLRTETAGLAAVMMMQLSQE